MKIASFLMGLLLTFSVLASRIEVDVVGMSCGMCASSITKELTATEKVENISVSLEDKKAHFSEIKGKNLSNNEIKSAIKKAGYEVAKITRK